MEEKIRFQENTCTGRFPMPFCWREGYDVDGSADDFISSKASDRYYYIESDKEIRGSRIVTLRHIPQWGSHETTEVSLSFGMYKTKRTMNKWKAYENGLISKTYRHFRITSIQ